MSGRAVNVVVVGVLALTVGATVFLAVQLTHPLDGMFGIGPGAFVDALDEMRPDT